MSYSYQTERPWLFTEDGQVALLKIRDRVFELLKVAGAFRASNAWQGVSVGDSWKLLALLDRLVELGDIRKVTSGAAGQDEVYINARRS